MEITIARLDELLATVKGSASALRSALTTQHGQLSRTGRDEAGIAVEHGLPFHVTEESAKDAAILRVACERLAKLVTPPRHAIFETAGSVRHPHPS